MKKFILMIALLVLCVGTALADTITFSTPSGATTGGQPVNATAIVTTGAGTVTITLTNLQANPTSVVQNISGFTFVLSNGATTGTLGSSSGQQINIAGDGTFALGSTGSTGWVLNNNVGGGLRLNALGAVTSPSETIIGPSGAGSLYSNGNGSIDGNGPHNPFLNQTATFVVNVSGVDASTTVTSATFQFGTTGENLVPGVPEPGSLALLGSGLLGAAGFLRRRFFS